MAGVRGDLTSSVDPTAGGEQATYRARFRSVELARSDIIAALVLAMAYYGGVHIGIALTLEPKPVSTLWPPNAILLTGLLLTAPRIWWLMIAAVFPAHLAAELSLGVPLSMTLLWFVSNAAEALIGAAIAVRILRGAPRFDRVRDLSVFLVAGVLIAPLLTSFLDAAFVALVGWRYSGDYWEVWRMRLFSNALASLTLVPLIVIWFQRGIRPLRQTTFFEHAEVCALLVGLCVTSALVFHYSLLLGESAVLVGESAVLMYVPLPFLMWAAVRHGVSGVSICVAIVSTFAITGVLAGRGPFASGSPESDALTLQVFLILVTASLMLLAASLAELRYARGVAVRQEESLELALGAAEMGTWEWDIDKDRVTWRSPPEVERDREARTSSQARLDLLERVHEDDRSALVRAIDSALEGADGIEVECRFLCREGYRWVTSKGKVVADAKGKPQRMMGVHIDTTRRKLGEMQLQEQQEQLTRLSRASILGELSGALAHELNQPLTAILINAQAARRMLELSEPDFAEVKEMLSDIVSEDGRAGAVISRLNALFTRGAVQTQEIAVKECIEEVLVLEHSDLIRRNVTLDVRFAEDVPAVIADRVQLQQVLLNLIVNACDAMSDNEPEDRTLTIVSGANAEGGVDIEISDSGRGIADIDKVFEPFFTTKDRGVGLGLAICRTIISAHRGRLWASNRATRGAMFHISLPAAPIGPAETDAAS